MNVEIAMGEIAVTDEPHDMVASGIGSCLIITLYDTVLQIGAFAHATLPLCPSQESPQKAPLPQKSHPESPSDRHTHLAPAPAPPRPKDTKYVDVAIDVMLQRMQAMGATRENIEAKLVGAANMFPSLASNIGKENVVAAKEKLAQAKIRIAGECTGGSQGRSVEFSSATGIVTVKSKF